MSLSNITDLAAANVQMLPGIIPAAPRKLHIRSLLPTGVMTTSAIHYLQETGSEGSVAAWADNSGTKSQIDYDLTEEVAPSEFIAGYLRITRKALDDISAMRSYLTQVSVLFKLRNWLIQLHKLMETITLQMVSC
jgi:hypothetical protein